MDDSSVSFLITHSVISLSDNSKAFQCSEFDSNRFLFTRKKENCEIKMWFFVMRRKFSCDDQLCWCSDENLFNDTWEHLKEREVDPLQRHRYNPWSEWKMNWKLRNHKSGEHFNCDKFWFVSNAKHVLELDYQFHFHPRTLISLKWSFDYQFSLFVAMIRLANVRWRFETRWNV